MTAVEDLITYKVQFQMSSSTIRYGPGVSKELGHDLQNLNAKNVCIVTDRNVAKLNSVKVAFDSLTRCGIQYQVYDETRVEPTDQRFVARRSCS